MKIKSIKKNRNIEGSRPLKFSRKEKLGGQAMITAVILFLFVSMTILLGIAGPILRQTSIVRDFTRSRESYFLAEAGMEDAIYRLKNRLPVASGHTLYLGAFSSVTDITDVSGKKVVITTADWEGHIRKIETQLEMGIGAAFNYGVQTGGGGLFMENNSGIDGNVYSNGDIEGGAGTYITGSAFAANGSPVTKDQDNIPDSSPGSSIVFRNSSSAQDFAQQFQVASALEINKSQFLIKKTGSPSNATVKIVNDNNGNPGTTVLTSGTLSSSLITTNYSIVDVVFTSNPLLTIATNYWIVIDNSSNSSSNYYTIGANTTYALGLAKIGQQGGTWNNTTPTGLDGYFTIHLGGITATIDGVTVGTGTTGDIWAHEVKNATARGNLYCQIGSGNNKVCNTTQGVPSPQGFPISQGNIAQWKSEAEAGGVINGNYTVNATTTYLGPRKIVGDLTIVNGAELVMTGVIWVTGNVNISNNAEVTIPPVFGSDSVVLVTDGYVALSNNVVFRGSGQSGSYIMILTTSDCPASLSCSGAYAIDLANNSDSVILNAQNGTIFFSNNAGAREAIAYKIHLENNALINYETGLASVNFSSGPSGGWDIESWKEVP